MIIASNKYKEKGTASLNLSVLILEKEVHSIIVDPSTKSIEAFDKVAELKDLAILNKQFADVRVIIVNTNFTLIPDALFAYESVNSYLNFSVEESSALEAKHEHIDKHSLHVVWGIKNQLKAELIKLWPGCSITHLMSQKLNSVDDSLSKNSLFADVLPDAVSVILFANGTLQLCNIFPTHSTQDALYYGLIALERGNVSPDSVDAYFKIGNQEEKEITPYFPNRKSLNEKFTCTIEITDLDKISCSLI